MLQHKKVRLCNILQLNRPEKSCYQLGMKVRASLQPFRCQRVFLQWCSVPIKYPSYQTFIRDEVIDRSDDASWDSDAKMFKQLVSRRALLTVWASSSCAHESMPLRNDDIQPLGTLKSDSKRVGTICDGHRVPGTSYVVTAAIGCAS